MTTLPYSFYDDLRLSPNATFTPLVPPSPLGLPQVRNLHRAVDPEFGIPDPGVILCHVPSFKLWTTLDHQTLLEQGSFNLTDASNEAYGQSAAALMAMQHFNNGIGSVAPELDGINKRCRVRLTTELRDTFEWDLAASYQLQEMFLNRKPENVTEPQMCALFGSSSSASTVITARSTSLHDIPQVSAAASSPALDSRLEFPTFARTHPSDSAAADKLVSYLQDELEISFFGMLYVNDAYGVGFDTAVRRAVTDRGMNLTSLSFSRDAHNDEIRSALSALSKTGFNYFFGVFYERHYEQIMRIAGEMKMAGPGRYWIFSGNLASIFVVGSTQLETGSSAAKATFGNSVLYVKGGLPGLHRYDNFVKQWRKLGDDPEALNYINSKHPAASDDFLRLMYEQNDIDFNRSKDFFQNAPTHFAPFSYDAIAGLGLAACKAQSSVDNSTNETFTGTGHFNAFIGLSFLGASGRVSFDEMGSRDPNTTYYVVSNIKVRKENGSTSTFRSVPMIYYDASTDAWINYSNTAFVYPGNSSTPPTELNFATGLNQYQPATRAFCLALSAIAMILSLAFLILTVVKRNRRIFKASQPPFLILICVGTLLLSSAIIPLTMDDGVASDKGCSIACTSSVWLLANGFCLAFSALFSKLWRINQVFKNAHGFKKVIVRARDVIVPLIILLGSNIIVLIVWTIESPFTWKREPVAYSQFGFPTESVGRCVSENSSIYESLLLAINAIAIIMALWQTYKGRNIQTEFNESKYITMAVVCIFEATFIGVPILLLNRDQPTAVLYIASFIIFVICVALLLLLFVPKILATKKRQAPRATNLATELAYRADSQEMNMLRRENEMLKSEIKALKGEHSEEHA